MRPLSTTLYTAAYPRPCLQVQHQALAAQRGRLNRHGVVLYL